MAKSRPSKPARERFRQLRILVLLLVLLGVAAWRAWILREETRPIDWSRTHPVQVCPILAPGADAGPLAARIAEAPAALQAWASGELESYGWKGGRPFALNFAAPVAAGLLPPRLPAPDEGFWKRWKEVRGFLAWFRAFDERFPPIEEGGSRIYLLLYAGQVGSYLEGRESVGTRRGRVGMVFAPDDPAWWGNTLALIAHETLHTVGALDHRDAAGYIAWPQGYAEPDRNPRHPQEKAEVMALGIPTSPERELLVDSLAELVLGPATAREIGWTRTP